MRLGWLLGALAALVALVLAGAYVGAYGPLVSCGADAAKVCVAWPALVNGAVWVLFLVFFICLTIWQVRAWRGSGSAVSADKHIVEDR
jgi:hypothetical protein